jgi:hypothetical protein
MVYARPQRLYKYRGFGNRTLEMLIDDAIYFADPRSFNDPLDSKPRLSIDISAEELEGVLRQLVQDRLRVGMSTMAEALQFSDSRTVSHINALIRSKVDELFAEIQFHATEPEEDETSYKEALGQYIQAELLRQRDRGVFSLARRRNCPLMWSHYGDQHRGLCLGYSIPQEVNKDCHKVDYEGGRLFKASAVAKMLNGDDVARHHVDKAVFLRKAKEWEYENEWRILGPKGLQNSPLELKEIVFGMRCAETVKYAVMKALESRHHAVEFNEIRERHEDFKLDVHELDNSELSNGYPRCVRYHTEMMRSVVRLPDLSH